MKHLTQGAGGEEESAPLDLRTYIEAPLRRPWMVVIPLVLLAGLSFGLSFTLQKRYRSSTLILVESQKVPDSVLRDDDGSRAPRLQTIRQEILSRTRLERVIHELDPYPELEGAPVTSVVEVMRSAIEISVKGNDAFSIEYTHYDPQKTQTIANRLATLFIEESGVARAEQVSGAAAFLESQLQDARRELEQKDLAIRRYKETRMGRLPEQTSANLATLQRMQLEQQSVADDLRAARQRLADKQSFRTAPPTSAPPGSAEAGADLAQLRSQLVALRTRYTDEHPDVRGLQTRIARLEKQLAEAAATGTVIGPGDAELRQAKREVEDLERKQQGLEGRIAEFQGRVEETPRTEQELATLSRDYAKLNENYLDLLKRRMDAQMAERRELRWRGEQFRVLDPAYLPEAPIFPRHSLFLLGGLIAGLLVGLTLAIVLEVLDTSVKSARQLEHLTGLPVLSTFPTLGRRPPPLERLLQFLRGTPRLGAAR